MSQTQHTPGPWTIGQERWEGFDLWDSEGQSVATAYTGNATDKGKANARLIAAAPDGLALARMVEKLTGSGEAYWAVQTAARDLINKAEGL